MHICLDGKANLDSSVVVLGMFDGVHRGHQVLLAKARVLAERAGVPLVVHTFVEHPLRLIAPEQCPPMLTTFGERSHLMEALGVDWLNAMPFTPTLRDMPPEEFVGQLIRQWKPIAVVVGFNYTFGSHGMGNAHMLATLGDALGFKTYVVPEIRMGGEPASATRIRKALAQGVPELARYLLGRAYVQRATVLIREENRIVLQCAVDGKQLLATGKYRALLDDGQHRYLVAAQVLTDGRIACLLPENAALEEQVTIEWRTRHTTV